MKTIKKMLPLFLIVIFAASVFYRISNVIEVSSNYQKLIAQGDDYAEKGAMADAVTSYENAMEIKPNIEISLKIGKIYQSEGELYTAKQWYENELLETYPNDVRTYEFGIETYLMDDSYTYAFEAYDLYQDRQLVSDNVEAMIDKIRYLYKLSGSYTEVTPYSNISNTAAVSNGETWEYVNTSASTVISDNFKSAGVFSNYAAVIDENGEAYYIDNAGEKKITAKFITENDPDFGEVKEFKSIQSGLILAYNGTYWNYYSTENYEKQFGGYTDATVITNDVGAVSNEQHKWALIDSNGKELTDYEYDSVVSDEKGIICRTDAIIAEKNGNYILIGKDGKQISDDVYQMAYAFNDSSYSSVYKNGRWFFVNEAGEELDLGDFEEARSFSNGLAAVKKNGKWGYINLEGENVIDYQFYDAGIFHTAGVAFVKSDKNYWTLLSLYRGKIG